jgi:hypothetical protein
MSMDENSESIQRVIHAAHAYHSAVARKVAFMGGAGSANREWLRRFQQLEVLVEEARMELTASALVLADEATSRRPLRIVEGQLTLDELLPAAKA